MFQLPSSRRINNILFFFGISILTLFLFSGSFTTFFTNDDFFLLKIAKVDNFREYLNFFNLTQGPDGLGMYRPLTTQVFYNLAWTFFNLNPFWLHLIVYLSFLTCVYLVYKASLYLTKDGKVSLLAMFFYAVSASHFGHLYYLATFQEIGVTIFCLLSVLTSRSKYFLSLIFFVLALMSKETAVVLPVIIFAIGVYLQKKISLQSIKPLVIKIIPYVVILFIYLYFRLFVYGLAQGDSYVWDFSLRFLNTVVWYGLWSLNIPEMFVDYVGPGLHINPNLFAFWSNEVWPIIISFTGFVSLLLISLLSRVKKIHKKQIRFFVLCGVWFVVTLLPVLFLPLHKFTFYLTLPMVSVSILIAYLASKQSKIFIGIVCFIYLLLSFFNLQLTVNSNWITQGSEVAKKVNLFLENNPQITKENKLTFIDSLDDQQLPWSPSNVLKNVLSDNNYFKVYYPGVEVFYGKESIVGGGYQIPARQFLAY